MLFVVIVIGETQCVPICLLLIDAGVETREEVEIRLCVCVCGDGGCPGWVVVVVSHPSPRPPAAYRFRFRFPGFWNPGRYVCVLGMCRGIIRLGTRRESYLTYLW